MQLQTIWAMIGGRIEDERRKRKEPKAPIR
jgi:hypothetical protein